MTRMEAHPPDGPPPPDATSKPGPFQPLVAKEHQGLGRIGVRLAFDKATGLPHIIALTRGGPAADFGHKLIRTMPVAMTTAAATRRLPKDSPKTRTPMSAANTTLVSRIAATSASGALVCAHSTTP